MANALAPRLLRRGLELFALISLLVFGGILLYGRNLELFVRATLSLQWEWVLVGLGVASLDWVGGGLRLWVLLRHVHPGSRLGHCVVSAGLNYWAALLTPFQTGGGPAGIFTLKRYGTPIPEAMMATFVGFVATIVFVAVAGPTAVALGAGQSLAAHGVLGGISFNDLFRLSLGGFVTIGLVLLALILFPDFARRIARRGVGWLGAGRSPWLARRIERIREGIDRAHEALVAFFRGRGWVSLALAVVFTGLALSNRLLAGYVVLRALDIPAPFVDVVLLQTLIMFLLYFAPTPGGSGLAEVLSAAVMSIYVPRELTPTYVLLWRVLVGYLTVGVGSVVFWRWLKQAGKGIDH